MPPTAIETANLKLPLIAPSQAQKHVTHNEALATLDTIVQLAVESRNLALPPSSPATNARYIPAAAASGLWAGHAGDVASFVQGTWMFHKPAKGWIAYVVAEDRLLVHDGTEWRGSALARTDRLGVNATADNVTRLSVSAEATLLSGAGASHRLKINKAAAADTASIVFQTGFSGRAEIGLAGTDGLRVKTSADGTAWKDALKIDAATARVTVGADIEGTAAFNVQSAFRVLHPSSAGALDIGYDGQNGYLTNYADARSVIVSQVGLGSIDLWTGNQRRMSVSHQAVEASVPVKLKTYARAALPAPVLGAVACLVGEPGGPVLAFADGSAWRRIESTALT